MTSIHGIPGWQDNFLFTVCCLISQIDHLNEKVPQYDLEQKCNDHLSKHNRTNTRSITAIDRKLCVGPLRTQNIKYEDHTFEG